MGAGGGGHSEGRQRGGVQQVNLVEIRLDFGDGSWRVDSQTDFFADRFDFPDKRGHLLVSSTRTVIPSAPALAKGSIKICGREHMM